MQSRIYCLYVTGGQAKTTTQESIAFSGRMIVVVLPVRRSFDTKKKFICHCRILDCQIVQRQSCAGQFGYWMIQGNLQSSSGSEAR
jgi:hypothetical protein